MTMSIEDDWQKKKQENLTYKATKHIEYTFLISDFN